MQTVWQRGPAVDFGKVDSPEVCKVYNTCVLLRVLAAQTCRKRRNSLRINMKTLELTLQVGDFVV